MSYPAVVSGRAPVRVDVPARPAPPPAVLTWGFVVCTCNREPVLTRALRLALAQTRRPAEVVIVDASPDWEAARGRILDALRPPASVRWVHVGSTRRSLPHQRNIAVGHAAADVVFLFDDDTLMYPDCAEEIMRVYELDGYARIAGVSTVDLKTPPEEATADEIAQPGPPAVLPRQGLRERLERRLTGPEARFLPYDGGWHRFTLPTTLTPRDAGWVPVLGGFRMTFRREVIRRVGFAEYLEGYAMSEDLDASYRVSREGGLVTAWRARVHHMAVSGGRPNRRRKATMALLNMVAMNMLHAPPHVRVRTRCVGFMLRQLAISIVTDLGRRRLSFPDTRGTLAALRHAPGLLRRRGEELQEWYLALQKGLFTP